MQDARWQFAKLDVERLTLQKERENARTPPDSLELLEHPFSSAEAYDVRLQQLRGQLARFDGMQLDTERLLYEVGSLILHVKSPPIF